MYRDNLQLYNYYEFNEEFGMYSRLPENIRTELNKYAADNSFMAAGCEVRFQMESDEVVVHMEIDDSSELENAFLFSIFFGGFQYLKEFYLNINQERKISIPIKKPDNFGKLERMTIQGGLPYDPNLVRILLPFGMKLKSISVEGDIQKPVKDQYPQEKLLIYGSSISAGASAIDAGLSYSKILSRLLQMDVRNLGFPGCAFLDRKMADYIAGEEFTTGILELGINVFEDWSIEKFLNEAEYFIKTVASQHMDKWIFVVAIFPYVYDFETEHPNFLKLQSYRKGIKEIIKKQSLPKLKYIDVHNVFDTAEGLSVDRLHPSNAGHEEIARYLFNEMKKYM